MERMTADVIVVGSGAAGCYAALRLKQLGLNPLVVTKGLVGKGGCSIFAGNLIISGKMLDSTDEHVENTFEFLTRWFNHFLVDQDYLKNAGTWIAGNFYPELDEQGMYFRRDDQGTVVTSTGKVRLMVGNQQGQSGVLIMDRRRKQLLAEEIPTLEETTVTSLLTDDEGHVIGVTGLHYPTGKLCAIRAKAVVLATGHADRLAKRSTGTREQSADGIALAYRVGAELMNLEIQWWHTSDFAHPRTWQRMHIYPNPLAGTSETARMYNSDGEMFYEQKTTSPIALAPYATQLKKVGEQVMKGKARFDGGYTTSYDHIDPQVVNAYNQHSKAFDKLGYSVADTKMESAISWHFRQGGIYVDPHTMETTVPGLFVAGGVGGHSNGSVAVATFDGNTVAETLAGKQLSDKKFPSFPERQIRAEEERLLDMLRPMPAGGVPPMHIKNLLWQMMWDKMGFIKTETRMKEALAEVIAIRRDLLPRVGLKNTTKSFNYGWVDYLDILNMLDVCEITIQSALNRKESRGAFYRTDHPYTDNKNWLIKNILRKGDDKGDLKFRTEPYAPKYIKPEFEKKEFFSVNW